MKNPTNFTIPCPQCGSTTSLISTWFDGVGMGVTCLNCDKEMHVGFWHLWATVCEIEDAKNSMS